MTSLTRLDSVSREVSDAFRQANDESRREAARAAAELAVVTTGIKDESISEALAVLRSGITSDVALRARVESLADELDGLYFRLAEANESSRDPEMFSFFSRARAASAVAHALADDPSDLHEAVYEAASAMDNAADLLATVKKMLL